MGRRKDLVGTSMQRRQPAHERAAELELRDSRVLGAGDFVEELLRQTEAHPMPAKMPLEEIIARVCDTLELPVTDLMSLTRRPRVAHARSIICHLAFAAGHRGVDIARRLRLTASAVSIACRRGKEAIAGHPALHEMVEQQRL